MVGVEALEVSPPAASFVHHRHGVFSRRSQPPFCLSSSVTAEEYEIVSLRSIHAKLAAAVVGNPFYL